MHTSIIYIDRHWSSKMRLAIRNDNTGLWDFQELAAPLPPLPVTPKSAQFIRLDHVAQPCASELVRSFVRVSCTMPLKLDGFPNPRKSGFGLVVDAERGLVVVSRAIVPNDLCDISVTIAESIIVEGKVLFMHPLQNYAVVQYDPKLVLAPVQSAKLSADFMRQGMCSLLPGEYC